MQGLSNRTYMLAIKRGNKDYLPLEWNVLPCYENENLNTLGGIDTFTSKLFKVDLIDSIISEGIISDTEKFQDFVTIYKDNGRYREVKEGTIFKEDDINISTDNFIEVLVQYGTNKNFRNYILNINFGDMKSLALEKFLFVVKNYDSFSERSEKALRIALDVVREIPYQEYRKLALSTLKRLKAKQI